MPDTMRPNSDGGRVTANSFTSYHGAGDARSYGVRGEAVILPGSARASPIGLVAYGGAIYDSGSLNGREATIVQGGLRMQPLFQALAGIDAALAVGYESRGFNLQPAVDIAVVFGRSVGATQFSLNALYGQGLREGERYGALRAAMLTEIFMGFLLGAEASVKGDLELDDDEPVAEPEVLAVLGPVLSYVFGPVVLTGNVGFEALRYRLTSVLYKGAQASVAFGFSL